MAFGILKVEKIGYAKFKAHLIPKVNKTSRPGIKMDPKYITIHNTGNSRADAEDHTKYVDAVSGYLSWHFTVDDKMIYQELPTNEVGWHAGDGRGPGNTQSVGIEICEHEGIDWEKAKYNAIKLIAMLCEGLNIPVENVVPHQKWSGKYCPRRILNEGWDEFHVQVVNEVRVMQKDTASDWAKDAQEWGIENGITDGNRPKDTVTREELWVIAQRVQENTIKAIIEALAKR